MSTHCKVHSRVGSSVVRLAVGATLSLAANQVVAQTNTDYEGDRSGSPSAGAMLVDLVVARPLGLAATVLGSVVFVAGLPFELLAGNVRDPARKLVLEPGAYTFTRPLGEDIN